MKALFVFAVAFVFLPILSGTSASQQSPFKIRRAGPLHHASLDLATGILTSTAGQPPPCWANTDTSGFFSFAGSTGGLDEWIVFGNSLTSADPMGTTGCPDGTDVIRAFSFGYASNAIDVSVGGPGAAMTLAFYHDPDGVGGVGPPALGGIPTEVMPAHFAAAFSFSGLPAATLPGTSVPSWVISVDLVASNAEFVLRDDGDTPGAFGFAWIFDQFGTGPLLCYAGNGLGGADGNGQQDSFDWYTPPAYLGGDLLGTFFSGSPPFDFIPQYLTLVEDDGICGQATISPPRSGAGNANGSYQVLTPAKITSTWSAQVDDAGQAGATLAYVLGYLAPLDVTIGLGTVLVDVFHPDGEVLRFAPSFFGSGGPGLAAFTAAVPLDLEICGTQVFSQAVRLGGGVQLTNAVDFTVGF